MNVVSTFLRAGVPISKIEVFRPLLEDTGYRLAGRQTMSDLIPFIHQEEIKRIREKFQSFLMAPQGLVKLWPLSFALLIQSGLFNSVSFVCNS